MIRVFRRGKSKDRYSAEDIDYVVPNHATYDNLHIPGDDEEEPPPVTAPTKYASYTESVPEKKGKNESVWSDSDYSYREIHHWSNRIVEVTPWWCALVVVFGFSVWIFLQIHQDMNGQQQLIYILASLFIIGLTYIGAVRARYRHNHEYICVRHGDFVVQYARNKWLFLLGNEKAEAIRNFRGKDLEYTIVQRYITNSSNLVITLEPERNEVIDGKEVTIPAKTKTYKRIKDGDRLMQAMTYALRSV